MAGSYPQIKLYAVSTCSHCRALMEFLQQNRLPFEFVYVDELLGEERRDTIKKVKQVNKRCSFPTTVIGEAVVVGFKEDELKEVLGI
ncbi:Glutaredoxin [Desulforhopalus singaporensis]|uniref:Glutaredoxin n=2 Tax=Desulforhopalus singaporensis TaxID=91360 RepID=A0A1H0IWH7_9BACT|nr:Glutaredoxin [Desulforhopalus singaporensis]